MANAVEEALNRANADQRAQINSTINQARQNIQDAELKMANSPSNDAASIIAQNKQIIEDAQRSIPVDTMKTVDEVSPPMNTPSVDKPANPEPVELNSTFKASIFNIEQGGGNNYLNENAMDRAMARPAQETKPGLDQQQSMGM